MAFSTFVFPHSELAINAPRLLSESRPEVDGEVCERAVGNTVPRALAVTAETEDRVQRRCFPRTSLRRGFHPSNFVTVIQLVS